MKEASVDSHGTLYNPLLQIVIHCMTTCPFTCLDKEPHAKKELGLSHLCPQSRGGSNKSMNP